MTAKERINAIRAKINLAPTSHYVNLTAIYTILSDICDELQTLSKEVREGVERNPPTLEGTWGVPPEKPPASDFKSGSLCTHINGTLFWVGQIWKETDRGFTRYVKVIDWSSIKGVQVKSLKTGRLTWNRAHRFGKKYKGYIRPSEDEIKAVMYDATLPLRLRATTKF